MVKTSVSFFILFFILSVFATGCGGGNDNGGTATVSEAGGPGTGEEPEINDKEPKPVGGPIPAFFVKPFSGNYYNIWPFDHELPLGYFSDNNGSSHVLGFRGDIVELYWGDGKGHDGYDWGLPEGTPLLAVADGEVVFAGLEEPHNCGTLGEKQALVVVIRHTAPNSDILETMYVHMSRIDVETGESVRSGQIIGLSGNTGCSSGAHLHFSVFRLTNTNNGKRTAVDPFGWQGTGEDPWAVHPDGAESSWLWKTGETPLGDYSFLGWDGDTENHEKYSRFHSSGQLGEQLWNIMERSPDIANLSFIGVTHEGRHIWILKISDNVHLDEGEPAVLVMSGSHAREWLATEIPFCFAEHLVDGYDSDPEIKEIVDSAEIWVLPMMNPDGNEYSRSSDRFWRKNRRPNDDGTFGVDLNRNWGYAWESGDSDPDSDFYRGPEPFSEPETRAVLNLLMTRNFKAVVDYHAYTQVIMYPSGNEKMKTVSDTMSELILDVHGKKHRPLSYDPPLYPGSCVDWSCDFGVDAFLMETRPDKDSNTAEYPWLSDPSRFGPFDPPETEIKPVWEENRDALMYLIRQYTSG